jgi:hypothetical protein
MKRIFLVLKDCCQYYTDLDESKNCRVCTSIKRTVKFVRFEVFTAVTMKNGVIWDVTQCSPCKNRRFGVT